MIGMGLNLFWWSATPQVSHLCGKQSHGRVLVEQGDYKAPTILPQPQKVFPVYLCDQEPHGQLRLRASLQSRDQPFHVMLTV